LLLGAAVRFSLFACVFLAACCGFSKVGNDGGNGGGGDVDMAGGGGGGDDVDMAGGGSGGGGGGGGGGTSMCTGCGCGAPVLMVAVQSVNGATGVDGRVLQRNLPATGAATACGPDLKASGALSKSPTSISWVPPDGILWGSSESIIYLDGIKDQIRWTYRPTQFGDVPRSLFTLTRPAATDVVAIGYDTNGSDQINVLAMVDLKDGKELKWWDIQSSTGMIYLGSSVPSMARDPFDSSRVAYINNGITAHPAMQTTLPWDGNPVAPGVWYMTRPPGNYPKTLNSYVGGGLKRAVWAQATTSSTVDDVIYEIDDDGTGPTLHGPLKCADAAICKQPFKTSDAVPDPTMPERVLATCDGLTSNVKHVVRIDATTCEQIIDGSKLLTLTYPVALAVGPAR
jgi:hypothetical protein